MSVVNTENYSQGPLPTVFEKQVLFEQPQVQDAQYKTKRSGGGMTAFLIFLAMLVPCGLLGYVMYTQSETIKEFEETANSAEEARLDGLREQIRTLEADANTLSGGLVEVEEGMGRLLNERQGKLREIRYDIADLTGAAVQERLQLEAKAEADAIAAGTFNEASPPVVEKTPKEEQVEAYNAAVERLATLPDGWSQEATDTLSAYVDTIEGHRQRVISWTPPSRTPSRPVVPNPGSVVPNE